MYPTWAWFLVDQSGGYDKTERLRNQFRALNLPAIKHGYGIYFDKTAADASSARRGCCGVLLPSWDLYLHRNIGFSPEDNRHVDIDARIRGYPLTEHCGLERRTPGTIQEGRSKANNAEGYRAYTFWERGDSSEYSSDFRFSFHDLVLKYKRIREPILVYACE